MLVVFLFLKYGEQTDSPTDGACRPRTFTTPQILINVAVMIENFEGRRGISGREKIDDK